MSAPLWDKGGASDAGMLRYTSRDDWRLDQRLLPHDLRATLAHVRGLGRIGVLASDELESLERELTELMDRTKRGDFNVTEAHEDGHTAIEEELVARLGDAGKKVHTGRSRNDQVLVAVRLYARDSLDTLSSLAREAGLSLLELARRETMTPMPGYTHLQRAVPSCIGLWAGAFAEGLADAMGVIAGARALVNRSPLGAAASFGVNLALDREGVARELGFDGIMVNPLGSQTSRGLYEAEVLGAAWQVTALLRRLAWDLSLYTTSEFGFVKLPPEFTTGSSIMPQKKNPDVVELMRGSCAVVEGALAELRAIVALPSGYHRDLQLTKAPLMRGLDEAIATTSLVPRLVGGLSWNHARLAEAISPECYATDRAVELAVRGVPFRDAYREIAASLDTLEGDAALSLGARTSPGAPGDLRLEAIAARLR